ncbi:MAG: helix-turn-helix domain-containing protein [Solirubrobacteraceae bacterium]|nr:helix-turn-helix domain-containing protein [Patulibacter sp.]
MSTPDPATARPPLRRDAQRNRDRILEAARRIFREQGASAPVEEIARGAEVGMGTLYRHFPTKDALIDAIAVARFAEMVEAGEEAVTNDNAAEGLEGLLRVVLEMQIIDRGFRDALSAVTGLKGGEAIELRDQLRGHMTSLLRRAQAAGQYRDDLNGDDISALIWSTGRIVERAGDDAERLATRFQTVHLDGFRTATPSTLTA